MRISHTEMLILKHKNNLYSS